MSYRLQSEQEDSNLIIKICHITIVSLLQFVVLFIPLFFLVKNEEIFEFNKMILTYSAVILIATFWSIKTIIEKKITLKKTPFDWFIILFFLSQLISTALSMHPRTSLFGYYTRFHGGLFSTISYIILFYSTATFVTKKQIPAFIVFVLIGAALSTLYAFPEHFGYSPSCLFLTGNFDASCWIQDVQTRVFGTFGQPNWLAAYLILLLPLSAALTLFKAEKNESDPELVRIVMKVTGLSLTLLMFATLLYTKSRSGVLGFGVGWAFFVGILLFQQIKERSLKTSKVLAFVGILFMFAIITSISGTPFTPSLSELLAEKNKPAEQTAAPSAAVDRLEVGGTDSGEIRRIVWKGAIAVWKRYPLFGSGVETFAYSYYRDRPMEHNTVSEWDFLYNKAHNEELNFLATTGIIGLGTYLLFIGLVGWFLLKEALFGTDHNTSLLSAALLAGLIGLHISNFLGFSTVMVSILMYVLPALVINQISDERELSWSVFSLQPAAPIEDPNLSTFTKTFKNIVGRFYKSEVKSKKIGAGQWVMVSICSMAGLFFLVQVATIWFADHYYSKAKEAYTSNDYSDALNELKLAIQLSPKEALYYELYSKIASQYAISALQQNENEIGSQFAESALEASETSLALNPVHINFYKTRNQVLVTLAQARPELFDTALQTLQTAKKLSPTDPKLVYYSALVENAQDKMDQTKQDLRTAISMKPNYDSARFMLGQLLENDKDYAGAKEQYQYILDNIAPNNDQVKKKLDAVATFSAKKK